MTEIIEWDWLSEEERYGLWSTQTENNKTNMSYPAFCDRMDDISGA